MVPTVLDFVGVKPGVETEQPAVSDSNPPRRSNEQVVAWSLVVSVSVLVFGRWILMRGRLLGYDWVSGPHDRLPGSLFGGREGRPSVAPVVIARRLLSAFTFGVDPVAMLLLLGAPVAAYGYRQLLGRENTSAWVTATAFTVLNLFVYQRLASSTFGLVLGLLLLPCTLAVAGEVPIGGSRAAARLALLLGAEVALLPQFVVLAVGPSLLMVMLAARSRESAVPRPRLARRVALSLVGLSAISLYWLVPAFDGGFAEYDNLSATGFTAYATRGAHTAGRLWNVISLGGMWRNLFPSPLDRAGVPLFAFLLECLLVLLGLWVGLRDIERRRLTTFAVVMLIGGALLSLGASGPTGAAFIFLSKHLVGFKMWREPGKAEVLLVVAYAILLGQGVGEIVRRDPRPWLTPTLSAAAISLAVLAVPGMAGGLGGQLLPSQPPSSWRQAAAIVDRDPGTILALPWHRFLAYPFAQGRVVENPTPYFFGQTVIASTDPELPQDKPVGVGLDTGLDRRQQFVTFVMHEGPTLHNAGAVLAALGVKWVLVESAADSSSYAWLDRQADMTERASWRDLLLYRVLGATTTAYRPGGAVTVQDWGQVLAMAEAGVDLRALDVTVDHPAPGPVVLPAGPVPATAASTELVARDRPATSTLTGPSPPRGTVVFTRPIEDGWRRGQAGGRPELGAIVAFPAPAQQVTTRRWRLSSAAILASCLSVSTLLAIAWPRSRSNDPKGRRRLFHWVRQVTSR